MSKQLRLIVLGIAGRIPFAGVAWQTLHYLEGFRRLGHDVYYIEDSWNWPFDPEQNCLTNDSRYALNHIAGLMAWCGMEDRWAYRAVEQNERIFGLSDTRFARVFDEADALINLSASELHEEHLSVPIRAYLETDPVLPQVKVAQGNSQWIQLLGNHTHHFTYGENIGTPGCGVPTGLFRYVPTRQPIVLESWCSAQEHPTSDRRRFTTIANWQQSGKDVEWNGETYAWSKHHEFLKFIDLPRRTARLLELALSNISDDCVRVLRGQGWSVIDSIALSKDMSLYRDYILGSRGEFTVAKDQNIRLRSGWFSDRSACYLASGRPVVTQDTGFGRVLPTGEGLFAFNTMENIVEALQAIESDYAVHSRAALEIAREYFCARKVLTQLLDDLGM